MQEIIKSNRGLIISCDIPIEECQKVFRSTCRIEKVVGYKFGFELALRRGLNFIVDYARKYYGKEKIMIYDHQKGATDIPHTARSFVRTMKDAYVDAVIFYPQSGPNTQRAWTLEAQERGLGVIIGGLMTHNGYLRSEGGYMADESVEEIYINAIAQGVNNFALPATKNRIDYSRRLVDIIKRKVEDPVFYFIGVGAQSGDLNDVTDMNLERYHLIIGRGVHQVKGKNETDTEKNITKATLDYVNAL